MDETQTRYERDEAENIPWQKSSRSLSAFSPATYNIFKTITKRIDSGESSGVYVE
jgi:hypothetical protein